MKNKYSQRQKKWAWYDTLLLIFAVASPVISVLCSIFIPGTTVDGRIAIIVGGFTIQIVLVSIQIKLGINPILEMVEKNRDALLDIEKTVRIVDETKKSMRQIIDIELLIFKDV